MTPTQPICDKGVRFIFACLATLALTFAACGGANPLPARPPAR